MKYETPLGTVGISEDVFAAVSGAAATNCYGVKGMAYRTRTDGIVHLLRKESMSKGVRVKFKEDNTAEIELHIIIENGVNIAALCRSIMSQVRYTVQKTTGIAVSAVDVYIDSLMAD